MQKYTLHALTLEAGRSWRQAADQNKAGGEPLIRVSIQAINRMNAENKGIEKGRVKRMKARQTYQTLFKQDFCK